MSGSIPNGAGPATVSPDARIEFLDVMRSVAVLMVAYDHLVGLYLKRTGQTEPFYQAVTQYVVQPLGIIQDFGWMGVCLFFLVSGFIITHVAYREKPLEFMVRRVFRIYPPLIVAIVVAVVILRMQNGLEFTPGQVLLSFTLLNYFQSPQVVTLGVAWSLVVELLFYGLVVLQMRTLRSFPALAPVLAGSLVLLVILTCKDFGSTYFLFAATAAYVPYLLIGQVIYLRATRRIGNGAALALAALCFGAIVFGIQRIHTQFLPMDNSYLVNFAYALLLFVIALSLDIRPGAVFRSIAEKSYGIYLLEGTAGLYLVFWLQKAGAPYLVALTGTIVIGYAICWAFFRFVERPSQNLGRRLGSRIASAPIAGQSGAIA
ncbi:MAG TPA: acyltransferase [Rhodocyclaceae bacterium]|nr:acyltransferase [Rhodocyclaceae bacterium]HMV54836.1 acyltransferase [Rhodocyclaceae bacterium]HMZ84591.1 acyltransferase [Rhodocyclaceae bacterium]HNA03939.1 acyltransferase [Rhodocyclaceae bacterium]HNB78629.1 acyltransferase [Rhodocyclaceae bacterium]